VIMTRITSQKKDLSAMLAECCPLSVVLRELLDAQSRSKVRNSKLKKMVLNAVRDLRPRLETYLYVGHTSLRYDMIGLVMCLALISNLSQLHRLTLKFKEMLRLWAKVLYLLIFYIRFSEFSSRLRPPCTTMPWTIWPALAVLWGVCWMFYGEYDWGFGDQDNSWLLEDANTMTLLTGKDPSSFASPDAKISTDLNYNYGQMSYDMSMPNESYIDLQDAEHQSQLLIAAAAPTSNPAEPSEPKTTSLAAKFGDNTNRSLPFYNTGEIAATTSNLALYQVTGRAQGAAACNRLEEADSEPHMEPKIVTLNDGTTRTTRRTSAGGSDTSRHSQNEKYYCHHFDCPRSQPGSGFRRKDNLDQHLRGPHNQSTVTRLRARSKAKVAQDDYALATPSEATGTPLHSKKRKRGGDEGVLGSSEDGLRKELIEERKARKLAEEENQELRQKVEDCERRIIKNETTLDAMMSLLAGRKGKERETI
jgi:hypothetical protein